MNTYLFTAENGCAYTGLFGFIAGMIYVQKDRAEVIAKESDMFQILARMYQKDVDKIIASGLKTTVMQIE